MGSAGDCGKDDLVAICVMQSGCRCGHFLNYK